MKKALIKTPRILSGNCSDLSGNCSDLSGNFDDCEITEAERKAGVNLTGLFTWGS